MTIAKVAKKKGGGALLNEPATVSLSCNMYLCSFNSNGNCAQTDQCVFVFANHMITLPQQRMCTLFLVRAEHTRVS